MNRILLAAATAALLATVAHAQDRSAANKAVSPPLIVVEDKGGASALRATRPSGPRPSFHGEPDERTEAAGIAAWMKAAHAKGIGSCWIGFAHNVLDEPEIKKELGLPEEYELVAPLIIGYPAVKREQAENPIKRKPVEINFL